MPIRVFIADDHPVFRQGLSSLLDAQPDLELVGEAADGATAVSRCGHLAPDVVLMDLKMSGLDGLDAIEELRRGGFGGRVIVLSMHADDRYVREALRRGAWGYLCKDAQPREILRAIRAVSAGQLMLGTGPAARLTEMAASSPAALPPRLAALSRRELDILELVARGMNPDAIARRLGVAQKTIRNNLSALYLKLQVADRAEAVVLAREAGLGTGGDLPGHD